MHSTFRTLSPNAAMLTLAHASWQRTAMRSALRALSKYVSMLTLAHASWQRTAIRSALRALSQNMPMLSPAAEHTIGRNYSCLNKEVTMGVSVIDETLSPNVMLHFGRSDVWLPQANAVPSHAN